MIDERNAFDTPEGSEGSNAVGTEPSIDDFIGEHFVAKDVESTPDVQAEGSETPQDNDTVRYQYWQSMYDKMRAQNEKLQDQLVQMSQYREQPMQAQPQGTTPEREEENTLGPQDFPPPPEKPQMPYNFSKEEADTDPLTKC